uniref:Retrovirus-related Pol polyprotein from transposon TNT 1-94 n=1 Tax=Cajanus cajan TaxID=3821 RepID=A0A151SK12_CAJCA|nr:Retrovirus-related Pol polyprotein from transposon TNT 1-94 [Cajanus cajan]
MNQTLLQCARCMHLNVGLSKEFWVKTINIAIYLVNRSPSTIINLKTPQEVWSGKPFDYIGLRIFGCPTYAQVNDGKLEPRAMKCIFLSYSTGVKGYRIWCTKNNRTKKFVISRNVTFNESAMFGQKEEVENLVGNKNTNKGAHQKVELEVEDSK